MASAGIDHSKVKVLSSFAHLHAASVEHKDVAVFNKVEVDGGLFLWHFQNTCESQKFVGSFFFSLFFCSDFFFPTVCKQKFSHLSWTSQMRFETECKVLCAHTKWAPCSKRLEIYCINWMAYIDSLWCFYVLKLWSPSTFTVWKRASHVFCLA